AVNSFFSKFDLLILRPPPSSPASQRKNRGGYSFLRPQAMEGYGGDDYLPREDKQFRVLEEKIF
ncbi:hypothetical protein L195_g050466, partial [Trifolium pratense]